MRGETPGSIKVSHRVGMRTEGMGGDGAGIRKGKPTERGSKIEQGPPQITVGPGDG